MNRIGIFGTSGMAKEAGDIAWEIGYSPIYVARDGIELEAIASTDEVILENDVNRYRDIGFVIGIGDNRIRQEIARRHLGALQFISLIHPSASFGRRQREHIESKRGVIVCAGVRFTNSIQIGDHCIFNLNCTISHDVMIDECVYVAPGAHITGNVHIGARSWIGTGAAIHQGANDRKLQIGENTIVGSGAVVTQDCDSNATYAGVPARRIK